MNLPDWFWSTAVGASGMAALFALLVAGGKRRGPFGTALTVAGFIIGGASLYLAFNDELMRTLILNYFH